MSCTTSPTGVSSEWLVSSYIISIKHLNVQHTENKAVFLNSSIHGSESWTCIYDHHTEYLQDPSQWLLTKIIIQTAQLDTIHFTYTNTTCLNSLFSALGTIKCRDKWQYLRPVKSAVLKHPPFAWLSPWVVFKMVAQSSMDGSSSASYIIGMAENCLHMKSACPQTGDFDLIYGVWWWMTVGSSEYISPDSPGLKQPYKESYQNDRLPFKINEDKLLKAETRGPTSCSDQLLFLYVSAQK